MWTCLLKSKEDCVNCKKGGDACNNFYKKCIVLKDDQEYDDPMKNVPNWEKIKSWSFKKINKFNESVWIY